MRPSPHAPRVIALGLCLAAVLSAAAATAPAAEDGASFAAFDRRARAGEPLTVVFFGASLTWGANATDQAHTSYRADVARRLEERYPRTRFTCHDAAIGGTGSQLGVFRVERDVLRWKPDLVFLDFSANDDIGSDDPETLASYEAIVRRLVDEAKVPVVQVAFPFRWNIDRDQLPKMKRLAAHRAIAEAYGCGWGDAITLIIERVGSGAATLDALWDTDPVHPGDAGYELFAEAAWRGFTAAVDAGAVGRAPQRMLNPDTYRALRRVRLDSLGVAPTGWRRARPNLTARFYDWTMSRWMDGELVACNRAPVVDAAGAPSLGSDGKPRSEPCAVAPLALEVRAASIVLFGEATAGSGGVRVLVDGRPVPAPWDPGKGGERIDANRWQGGGHLVIEVARGLDPAVAHRVEIQPLFAGDAEQELRLESLCVAGGDASVAVAR